MEINVVELIVQAGALGALVLVLVLVGRYGKGVVDRLMDTLDRQAEYYKSGIETQAETANAMAMLCKQIDDLDEDEGRRNQETVEALAEVVKGLQRLGRQLQAHEGRMEKRFEQQMSQADERHQELVAALRGLNGK